MPALEKITGQSHGWLDLNFADSEGQGEQQRIKRTAFLKHAERWAEWWSKNWQNTYRTRPKPSLILRENRSIDTPN